MQSHTPPSSHPPIGCGLYTQQHHRSISCIVRRRVAAHTGRFGVGVFGGFQRWDTSRPFLVFGRSTIQLTRFPSLHLFGGKAPMSQRSFSLVATVVFLVVGIMHALRLFFGWYVELNGWIVPMWVSWVGLVIGLYLASEGIGLARKT